VGLDDMQSDAEMLEWVGSGRKKDYSDQIRAFRWRSIETAVHGPRNMESLASCLEGQAALYSSVLID
jgi:hypothetical protein